MNARVSYSFQRFPYGACPALSRGNPKVSLWLSVDPLAGEYPSISPYVYTVSDPVNFTDILGMIPWPVKKLFKGFKRWIASWYGPRKCSGCSKFHRGLDINFGSGNDDFGAPVLATHDGKVVFVKNSTSGAGRYIILQSFDGSLQTLYFHLNTINVKVGQNVREGEIIGEIGGSGRGKELGYTPHLHYAIKIRNNKGEYEWLDPTLGRGNKEENIVDPMDLINIYGPRQQSYYDFNYHYNPLFDPQNYAKREPSIESSNSKKRTPVTPALTSEIKLPYLPIKPYSKIKSNL